MHIIMEALRSNNLLKDSPHLSWEVLLTHHIEALFQIRKNLGKLLLISIENHMIKIITALFNS
jgi:hypothetical protein